MTGKIVYRRVVCDRTGEFVESPEYYLDGERVTPRRFRRAFPDNPVRPAALARPKGWPIYSDALAVHPDQIPEAREVAREQGVPTDFLPDGRAILRDREHRKRYLKANQFHDRDGYYGG